MYSCHIGLSEYTTKISFPFGSQSTQTNRYKAIRCGTYRAKAMSTSGKIIGKSTIRRTTFQNFREDDSCCRLISCQGIGFSRAVFVSILTYAPMGRNRHQNIGLPGSYAVPARNLNLVSLTARLKPMPFHSSSPAVFLERLYPPAIAPMTMNGSFPDTTASGSGASGGLWERSSSQAKKRRKGRRCWVSWSRIVPRSMG
jgi:hypothetical protein